MAKRCYTDISESWDEVINSPVTETESEPSEKENNGMVCIIICIEHSL